MDLWVLTNVEHPSKHQSNRAQKFPAPTAHVSNQILPWKNHGSWWAKTPHFFRSTQLYELVAFRTAARQIAATCLASCVGPGPVHVCINFDTCFLSHSSWWTIGPAVLVCMVWTSRKSHLHVSRRVYVQWQLGWSCMIQYTNIMGLFGYTNTVRC